MISSFTTTETFLAALIVIFALPWLIWRLARTDSYAPLVVVQIVTGILLGPGIAGELAPQLHAQIFSPDVIAVLNGIAWWAVMLFVWTAGLELDLTDTWKRKRETGITAGFAMGVPMVFGLIAAWALLAWDSTGWIGDQGTQLQFMAGIGMSCAVTALPILVLLMDRLGILRSRLGQRVLGYASLDDIAIWGVLALILLDWERMARQLAFVAIFMLANWIMRRMMVRLAVADRWALSMIWLAAVGLGADWAGLHFMVGAFLAGVVMDARWLGEDRLDHFRNTVLLALMPVFFLSTGLRTSWEMGGFAVIGAAALLLLAAIGGKLTGTAIAGRILGWQAGESRLIGWLLQTKALIMIIFANILLDRGIISGASFSALLLMAVASTVLTMPFARRALLKTGGQHK